jgi:hypothetical protein
VSDSTESVLQRWGGIAALLLVLGWSGYVASGNASSPSMLGHEFRQSQTALSAQIMSQSGWKLAYETPVLGKPWSIPMEFPLYQAMVAAWSRSTGWGIVPSGRLVAGLMFLAGLPAWWLLARMAGYSRGASALALVPIITAPIYIFYSRTVMIESTAWASASWFLWGVLRHRIEGGAKYWAVATGCGTLAVLVKGTTWAVFCLPWACLYLKDLWIWWRQRDVGKGRRLLTQALGIGFPLLALGWAWVAYADHLKAQNPVASFLASKELTHFNFGTWAARWDGAQWTQLAEYVGEGVIPWWAVATALLLGLLTRRARFLTGLALVAFVGGPLIFFNLYYLHDYYLYANGAFVCAMVGVGVAECWDRRPWGWKSMLPALLLLTVVGWGQARIYRSGYGLTQDTYAPGDDGLTRTLRTLTDPQDVIVVHSPGWSSSLPFYAERRVLTIPDSQMFRNPERVRAGVELLTDENVPLLAVVGESRVQGKWTAERIDQLGLWPAPLFTWSNHVNVYARPADYEALRQRLRLQDEPGVRINDSDQLLPVEERRNISDSPEGRQVRDLLGIDAAYGVTPHGHMLVDHEGHDALLVHATSELFFQVPANATTLSFAYLVNPASYRQKDFDGLTVMVDGVEDDRLVATWHRDWLSPLGDRKLRTVVLTLPPNAPSVLVLRVLPGPGQNMAYDQLWLTSFRFD